VKEDFKQLMSLDGIEYFPQEFAKKDFIEEMLQRKDRSARISNLKGKIAKVDDHAEIEQVDQFIS
jgi:hypothetical protein